MLTGLLAKIRPAVEANKDAPGEQTAKNGTFVQGVAVTNARLGAEVLTKKRSVLSDLVAEGKPKIVSAMHDIATGRVTFLD